MPETTAPDPVTACLAAWRTLAEAENAYAHTRTPVGSAVPRLLAAVEAVLARHQPGRYVVLGEVCSRHENHPFFSVTAALVKARDRVAAQQREDGTRTEHATAPLPGWDEMSDLDKGAALMHLHKREWEGAAYAESDYPCQYFDHPALTALTPLEACRHAAGLERKADPLDAGEHQRLYDLALQGGTP